MISADEAQHRAEVACQRIVDALDSLPPATRFDLALALAADEDSHTLSSIGEDYLGPDQVPTMAKSLLCEVFIGDAEETAERLSDAEPWGTIRDALAIVVKAWRDSRRPGARNRHDFQLQRERWMREMRESAEAAEEQHNLKEMQ